MMLDDASWHAIRTRDAGADAHFVYAVTSTGIYCRPSCPSRRPKRENVRTYALPEIARSAGFRACRRCAPDVATGAPDPSLDKVRRALAAIDRTEGEIVNLKTLGEASGANAFHLQRLFTKIVGISPRDYADAKRLDRLRTLLRSGDGVAGALYEAGYGSSSRLYEKADAKLGMTPATYRCGGLGAAISYAVASCALGLLLVATTAKGVAALYLGDDEQALSRELRAEFPEADIARDDRGLKAQVAEVLAYLAGKTPSVALPLDVQSTAFQRQVWKALQAIPPGETRTYRELAIAIGKPSAARAVGRACATNPASLVIPCHRAVASGGELRGYRWGLERKKKLIAAEAAFRRRAS